MASILAVRVAMLSIWPLATADLSASMSIATIDEVMPSRQKIVIMKAGFKKCLWYLSMLDPP
jgi:hypothetical protein